MILPTNGKVVIFDDEYKDVKKLLSALSQEKIPYFFFTDESGEDLPETPIKNIRLVFLDLQLVTSNSLNIDTIVSYIGARLQRVLEPHASYVLVYWSTKENKYRKTIDEAFENRLSDYKPVHTISLKKIEALSAENTVEFILNEIEANSDNFKILKVFSFWENLVNDSAGNLVNEFTDFINKDKDWDENAKYVLYKLASAYAGKQLESTTELEQIKNSYYTLNHTFIDSIENIISKNIETKIHEFTDVLSAIKGNDDFISIINNKLLISEEGCYGDMPGALFVIDNEKRDMIEKLKQITKRKIDNPSIPEHKREEITVLENRKLEQQVAEINSSLIPLEKNYKYIFNDFLIEQARDNFAGLYSESIKIELNISPLCDYAQNKMPCCRMLPGFLLKKSNDEFFKKNNAYNYFSDATINYNNEIYFFVFDFRFLHSKSNVITKIRVSKFKLRQQLLADIQLKLGSHINRAGVLYLA